MEILNDVDFRNENPKYSRNEFEKGFIFSSPDEKIEFYGLFDNNVCWASLYVKENPEGFSYINEFASFKSGKDYGLTLLRNTLQKYSDIWLLSNPSGGKKLADNYRKVKELKEVMVENSIFEGLDVHFFFKTTKEKFLKNWLTKTFSQQLS